MDNRLWEQLPEGSSDVWDTPQASVILNSEVFDTVVIVTGLEVILVSGLLNAVALSDIGDLKLYIQSSGILAAKTTPSGGDLAVILNGSLLEAY